MYDVFISEDFLIKAEVDEHCQVLVHIELFNWSKSVAKKVRIVAREALQAFRLEGFSLVYCVTDKPKLVQFIAKGENRGSVEHEGKQYEVIVWDFH